MGIRRLFILLIAGIAVAFVARAQAAEITLNGNVKAELQQANPLGGKPVDRALFDGKPLLVVFFASW